MTPNTGDIFTAAARLCRALERLDAKETEALAAIRSRYAARRGDLIGAADPAVREMVMKQRTAPTALITAEFFAPGPPLTLPVPPDVMADGPTLPPGSTRKENRR